MRKVHLQSLRRIARPSLLRHASNRFPVSERILTSTGSSRTYVNAKDSKDTKDVRDATGKNTEKKEEDPSQRDIDTSEKLIYEPHRHLNVEEQEKLIKAQVDVYFEKRDWKDKLFMLFIIIMSIVAGLYYFMLTVTKAFSDNYHSLLNRLLDERKELSIDIADFVWRFFSALISNGKAIENFEVDLDAKTLKNGSEWPKAKLTIHGLDLEKDILQHPDLAQILTSVFGTDSVQDLRMLNTNFLQEVNHILQFLPLVKDINGSLIKPYAYYFRSEIIVFFPLVNVKTNAVGIMKVVLCTSKDLKKSGKKVARQDLLSPEEKEAKILSDFQEEYKEKHGTWKYYYDSWNGTFQAQSLEKIEEHRSKDDEDNQTHVEFVNPNAATNSHKLGAIEKNEINLKTEEISKDAQSEENVKQKGNESESIATNVYTCTPYEGLSPEEELALRQKRLRDKKGLIRYYWNFFRGTLDLDEDFDIFRDDPSEDLLPIVKKKKKAKRPEKVYYFEELPLTVDKVVLCNPNPFMTDQPGFFNRVMGYSAQGNPLVAWPFKDYDEVVILENANKTQVGHYPFMSEATTGEAKQDSVKGHLFLDVVDRSALPPSNGAQSYF